MKACVVTEIDRSHPINVRAVENRDLIWLFIGSVPALKALSWASDEESWSRLMKDLNHITNFVSTRAGSPSFSRREINSAIRAIWPIKKVRGHEPDYLVENSGVTLSFQYDRFCPTHIQISVVPV